MKTVIFTFLIGLSLFNFPAKSQVAIEINTQSVVNKEFKGLGYNFGTFKYLNNDDVWNNVVGKRLKEINSEGLVRLGGFPLDRYAPDKDNRSFDFDLEFKIYDFLKEIKTDINYRSEYRNNPEWLGNGYMIKDTAKLSDYVSTQVELMTYLTKIKGYDHIKYWTIQNELSTREGDGAWGKWDSDAPAPGYPFMPIIIL